MIKNLSLLFFLAAASSYAMSYEQSSVQEVEERPSLGFYLEYGTPDSYEITYIEQNNNGLDQSGGESNGVIYENKTLDLTPTIGFAGHIPFIWDKYLDATATVGGSQTKITAKTTKTLDPDSNEIKLARRTRVHETFNIVIEGGPELGYPVYLDYKSQQIIKPFVQVRGIFIKTFNTSPNSNWKNDQAFGWSYVGGVRWSINQISFGAGIRSEYVFWEPGYDPVAGNVKKNTLKVEYVKEYKPWVTVEWGFY